MGLSELCLEANAFLIRQCHVSKYIEICQATLILLLRLGNKMNNLSCVPIVTNTQTLFPQPLLKEKANIFSLSKAACLVLSSHRSSVNNYILLCVKCMIINRSIPCIPHPPLHPHIDQCLDTCLFPNSRHPARNLEMRRD